MRTRFAILAATAVLLLGLSGLLVVYSQDVLLLGYALVEADPDSALPVVSALFSFHNAQGVFVSEAGVGAVALVAGDLGGAQAISEHPNGNLFVALTNRAQVISFDRDTGIRTTVAGTGDPALGEENVPATTTSLSHPRGLALEPSGSLLIATSNRIRRVDELGLTTVVGNGQFGYSGDGGPALDASLNLPTGVALDSAGNIFIADSRNCVIRVV